MMRISVKAKPNAKQEKVELLTQAELDLHDSGNTRTKSYETYAVWVKEPAVGGKANSAIAKALAKHFRISPSQVALVSGPTAKLKIFEINKQ